MEGKLYDELKVMIDDVICDDLRVLNELILNRRKLSNGKN